MEAKVGVRPADSFYVPAHIPEDLVKPFNIFAEPEMAVCPFSSVQRVRDNGRIFWNPTNIMFGGSWVLTRAEDIRFVLSNPKLFSNSGQAGFMLLDGEALELIPLELDPPRHTRFRQLLNPLLSPPAVAKMADGVTARAVELLDKIAGQGECDFVSAFAVPFPVSIFMQLMGLPQEEMPKFLHWENELVHSKDNERIQIAAQAVSDYLMDLAARRRADPTSDFTSYVVQAEIDGKKLTDLEVKGILYLLFLAGLDTVTATMGWFFRHLAENPDQQQRLRENPNSIPKAIEELMRRYSVVMSHRRCLVDVEVGGVQMREGDWISVMDSFGSTDPQEFAAPMDVDLDRRNVRHFGFSFGPHFCMGAHLARRELEVALREWLARIPMWRIKAGEEPEAHGGFVFGHKRLMLEWTPSAT